MIDILTYKGFYAKVWLEDKAVWVEAINAHSMLLVDGDSYDDTVISFKMLVDEHLSLCKERNLQIYKGDNIVIEENRQLKKEIEKLNKQLLKFKKKCPTYQSMYFQLRGKKKK